MIPYEERRAVPDESTTVTIEVRDSTGAISQTFDALLKEVRDGFAFTDDQVPYCLEDGAQYCHKDGGVFLNDVSLAFCKTLAERIPT